jgi:hypothetical protein
MKLKRMAILATLAATAVLALPWTAAQAGGVRVGLHIGIPFFWPVPAPRVYVAPPPVYYVQPAPVYVPVPVGQPVYQVPAVQAVPAAPQVSQYYYLPAQPVPIR